MNIINALLEKYYSLNVEVKAALWFTACSFMQKGISFITVPIFTRLMTLEQYGQFTLYISWLQIFTVITSLYLYNGVTDNALSRFENDRSKFISSMQGLTITITTGVMVMVFVFWNNIKSFLSLSPLIMVLMFVEMYLTPALAFWTGRQRFEYRYKILVLVTILKSVLNPVLGLFAVFYAEDKALARIISIVIVEALICGCVMVKQFKAGKAFYDRNYWKYAVTLAIPLLPHYLAGIVLNHGDRIMISKLVGTSEVALYGLAYSIGMLALIFVGAINSSLTPWIYGKLKLMDIKSIRKQSCGILFLIFCIALGLMLISPEIVLVFGSSKYAESVNAIPPVASSVFFIFLYNFLSFPEFYFEKTQFLMLASITAAGLNVILNYIFIPQFGYIAAAYTTLACYIIYSLGHYIVGGNILSRNMGFNSIIDDQLSLILSVTIVVLGSTVHLIFKYFVIRYMIIACGITVAFLKRDTIIRILTRKQ